MIARSKFVFLVFFLAWLPVGPIVAIASDPPSTNQTVSYVGTMLSRPGLYDLKPKIVVRNGLFEFYELGQYRDGDVDITPPDRESLSAGDRIYSGVATSLNGAATQWQTTPRVIYRGQGGKSGRSECDDHLVGSPALIDVGGEQYMLIESYGNWITRLVRNWSSVNLDTWTTASETDLAGNLPDTDWSYSIEQTVEMGFAPRYRVAGTHPVYSGELWYWFGKRNRFLSLEPVPWRVDASGIWRPLNNGLPVFFLYDAPTPDRKIIRQFFQPYFANTFVSDSLADDGGVWGCTQTGPPLGYSASSLKTSDTSGCLLNRLRLLRKDQSGIWRPIDGAYTGHAMLSPFQEQVAKWPHDATDGPVPPIERLSPSRYYGTGYPVVLKRDGRIEIYFSDDTRFGRPRGLTALTRISIAESDIANPAAWVTASQTAQECTYYFSDMKWSPRHQRYFGYSILDGKPELRWSPRNPPANERPTFPPENSITIDLPPGVVAGWGGLSGTEHGQLDERAGYIPVHVVFEQFSGGDLSDANSEVGHGLIFLWD